MSRDRHRSSHQAGLTVRQLTPYDRHTVTSDLVMAWARDRDTGASRYILELDENHRGAQCNCECVSCGAPVIAVNAARESFRRRPHFRHPEGTERQSCMMMAARSALLSSVASAGFLDLPSRRRDARVSGLSGTYYDAWVEVASERVQIASCRFDDRADAIVTLGDGRELRVILVGSHRIDDDGIPAPAVEILVDDPSLAGMSPQELRNHLRLLVAQGQWCTHWLDSTILEAAIDEARDKASDALDWATDECELTDGADTRQIRETLLHRKAKEILMREKRIMVPELILVERSQLVAGNITQRCREACMLRLESVALEQPAGNIRPDVVATTLPEPGWHAGRLHVEITVTHGIDAQRLERICLADVPTLEIDLARLGGKVTEAEFTRLVVDEVVGKRWVHHPAIESERKRFHAEQRAATTRYSGRPSPPRPVRHSHDDVRYPSQRYREPAEADFWLKGEALERWKKEHPESAAIWFPADDKKHR